MKDQGGWKEYVSTDISIMLEELESRKRKESGFKQKRFLAAIATMGSLIAYMGYLNFFILEGAAGQVTGILKGAFQPVSGGILLSVVGCFIMFRHFSAKSEEAKKKFDTLRHEAIDRMSTRWTASAEAELRATLSEEFRKKDINLVYKSK